MLTAQQICDFFLLLSQEDNTLQAQLKTFDPHFENAYQWQFSLATLGKFLTSYYQIDDFNLNHFRRTLFNSPVNHQLSQHNACIAIAQQGKVVDDNVYQLKELLAK